MKAEQVRWCKRRKGRRAKLQCRDPDDGRVRGGAAKNYASRCDARDIVLIPAVLSHKHTQ